MQRDPSHDRNARYKPNNHDDSRSGEERDGDTEDKGPSVLHPRENGKIAVRRSQSGTWLFDNSADIPSNPPAICCAGLRGAIHLSPRLEKRVVDGVK